MPTRNGQASSIVTIFIVLFLIIFIALIHNFPPQFPFALLLAGAIFLIAFIRTDFALIILLLAMLLSPELKVGAVTGRLVILRTEDIFLFIIFFSWLAKMAINKELAVLRFTPLNKPIIAYIFVGLLASIWGIADGCIKIQVSFFYFLKYIEYFLLFFMAVNNIKDIRQAKIFVFFILLTCFIVTLYAASLIPAGERVTAPFQSRGGEPNTLAGYLVLMSGIIIGLIIYSESMKQRFILFGLLAIMILPFLFTLSRSGWISFFPMAMAFVILSKRSKIPLAISFVVIIVLAVLLSPRQVRERVKETFAPHKQYTIVGKKFYLDESASVRIETWGWAFQKLQKRPILGYGASSAGVTDNHYARVLTESGIVGFAIFIWLLLRILLLGLRVYNLEQTNNFVRGLSLGFLSSFYGILVHALSSDTFILIRVAEPFWFLAAIVAVLPELDIAPDAQ